MNAILWPAALPQSEGQHGYFGPDNSVDKKTFWNRSFNLSMFLLHPLSIALLRGQIGACSVHHISHFIHYSFNALAVWYVADIFGCVVGCLMNSKLINAAQRKHSDGRLHKHYNPIFLSVEKFSAPSLYPVCVSFQAFPRHCFCLNSASFFFDKIGSLKWLCYV